MTLFLNHQKLPLSTEDEAKGRAGWARLVRETCLNMCRRDTDSPIRYFPHQRGSSKPDPTFPVELSHDEIHWLIAAVQHVLNEPQTRDVAAESLKPIARKLQASLPI
jgi:hypothetical protein